MDTSIIIKSISFKKDSLPFVHYTIEFVVLDQEQRKEFYDFVGKIIHQEVKMDTTQLCIKLKDDKNGH